MIAYSTRRAPIRRLVRCSVIPLVALTAASAVAQVPSREYASRRDSLAARIGDGVVVALGGRTPVTDFGPFYQLPAFHYLTNFHEPDAAMVLVAKGGKAIGATIAEAYSPKRRAASPR